MFNLAFAFKTLYFQFKAQLYLQSCILCNFVNSDKLITWKIGRKAKFFKLIGTVYACNQKYNCQEMHQRVWKPILHLIGMESVCFRKGWVT